MTSLSHCCFILAAVLYVDNADNIHTTALVSGTPKELIDQAQLSMNAWGGLAIATGAAMKPDKCFAYFLVYLLQWQAINGLYWKPPGPSIIHPATGGSIAAITHDGTAPGWDFCPDTHITTHNSIINAWNMVWTCITRHQTHCQDVPERH
jgi:hypothetical protein